MAGSKFNPERAAAILLEAMLTSDKAAVENHGITARTLFNWRERLYSDSTFSDIFRHKKDAAERDWASSLAPAIRDGIDFLARAGREANHKDPEVIHAIAGALKILTTTATKKEVLDATLNRARSSTEGSLRPAGIQGTGIPAQTGRISGSN